MFPTLLPDNKGVKGRVHIMNLHLSRTLRKASLRRRIEHISHPRMAAPVDTYRLPAAGAKRRIVALTNPSWPVCEDKATSVL